MDLNAQTILAELQTLRSDEAASVLSRLRELSEAIRGTIVARNRHSPAGIAVALVDQAIDYLCAGIEGGQNAPEIKRRFAIAIRRAEGWAVASAQARSDDPRLVGQAPD